MTDKEILYKVYEMLCPPEATCEKPLPSASPKAIRDFIHQEWQKQDELTAKASKPSVPSVTITPRDILELWRDELFAKNDDGQMYNTDNRHVGLEIDEDGTVTGIK